MRELDLATHHDRLFGARLLAEAAEHAARDVDVEGFGVALDARALELSGHDADAVGGTGELAEPAGDAARLPVLELHEHGHAAECVRIVDPLLGILHDEVRAILARDEAPEIAEEVPARDGQPLQDHGNVRPLDPAELLVALDLDDLAGHGRMIGEGPAKITARAPTAGGVRSSGV